MPWPARAMASPTAVVAARCESGPVEEPRKTAIRMVTILGPRPAVRQHRVVLPLSVSRTVAAPPDEVWRLLVEVEQWPRWGPSISEVQLDHIGDRIRAGSTGMVVPPIGVPLPFRVTDFVDGERWSWRVAGIPATSHRVEAVGAGTRVSFGVPPWAPAYLAVCALALRRLERLTLPGD